MMLALCREMGDLSQSKKSFHFFLWGVEGGGAVLCSSSNWIFADVVCKDMYNEVRLVVIDANNCSCTHFFGFVALL